MSATNARGTIDPVTHSPVDVPQAQSDAPGQATAVARAAADRAHVVVRPLHTVSELDAASQLIERIWNDGEPKAPTSLLRALAHAGGFVAGAFSNGDLVGISFGFFGLDDSELHLHSHITGIDPAYQRRSLGFALKQFQRGWALEQGIRTISWTADPLVRGNTYFNLVKLGATIVAYYDDFYGPLRDRLNAGAESDRVMVRWDLASERAVLAATGHHAEPQLGDGDVILCPGTAGEPSTRDARGDTLHAWIPEDIIRIREESPEHARTWRRAVRETIGRSLYGGYHSEAITRDGWLILRR